MAGRQASVGVLSFLAGALLCLVSCTTATYRVTSRPLPPDLDAYLAAQEAKIVGLIPADARRVLWAGAAGQSTPLSIVFLHGYQATPHDYDGVVDALGHALHANIYFARLSGYGVTTEAVADVTLSDWLNDAWEAMDIGRQIGDRVIVVGSSMGGDLALWLGSRHPPDLEGLVLLSCAVWAKDPRAGMLLWPWPLPQLITRLVVGKYNILSYDAVRYPGGDPALYARYYPARYRSESTIKLLRVMQLTRTLQLESIATPSVWLYSERDEAVDIATLKGCYQRVGSDPKRLVSVPDAPGHMLAGDVFSPSTSSEVVADIMAFLADAHVSALP